MGGNGGGREKKEDLKFRFIIFFTLKEFFCFIEKNFQFFSNETMEFYDLLIPANLTHEELKLLTYELQDALHVSRSYTALLKHSLARTKEENVSISKRNENLRIENKRLLSQIIMLEDFTLERERKLSNCMLELKKLKEKGV